MNFIILILHSAVFGIFVVAVETSKCAIDNDVGRKDRIELSKNPYHPSEKILCFLKCDYERMKAVKIDKTVDADKVVEHLNTWRPLKESTKERIRECVEKQTILVENCRNIEPYYHCVREAVQKEARETSQCETKHNVTEDDFKALNEANHKASDKMLCFFKCLYEENGTTNSDGVINVDKLIENVHKWKALTDASKSAIRECAKDLPAIKTCADVKASFDCVQTVVDKQVQAAA